VSDANEFAPGVIDSDVPVGAYLDCDAIVRCPYCSLRSAAFRSLELASLSGIEDCTERKDSTGVVEHYSSVERRQLRRDGAGKRLDLVSFNDFVELTVDLSASGVSKSVPFPHDKAATGAVAYDDE
jgi:hypothetical protein